MCRTIFFNRLDSWGRNYITIAKSNFSWKNDTEYYLQQVNLKLDFWKTYLFRMEKRSHTQIVVAAVVGVVVADFIFDFWTPAATAAPAACLIWWHTDDNNNNFFSTNFDCHFTHPSVDSSRSNQLLSMVGMGGGEKIQEGKRRTKRSRELESLFEAAEYQQCDTNWFRNKLRLNWFFYNFSTRIIFWKCFCRYGQIQINFSCFVHTAV